MKWYGVEELRVLYHYNLYAYEDYLQSLISTSISTFQLTSRGRSRHYMEVLGLPSVSGNKKLCRDCHIAMLFVTIAQYICTL